MNVTKRVGYSFRTDHANTRSRAAPAKTASNPGDFVGVAVAGTAGGVARRVVTTVAGVVTVVGTVVFTVAGTVVATVVGKVVRVLTLIRGFLSWSTRPELSV